MFTIEKTKGELPGKNPKYPFAQMKVGENFAFDSVFKESVSVCATSYVKRNNPTWKFSVRKDGDQYRCYRIQ